MRDLSCVNRCNCFSSFVRIVSGEESMCGPSYRNPTSKMEYIFTTRRGPPSIEVNGGSQDAYLHFCGTIHRRLLHQHAMRKQDKGSTVV